MRALPRVSACCKLHHSPRLPTTQHLRLLNIGRPHVRATTTRTIIRAHPVIVLEPAPNLAHQAFPVLRQLHGTPPLKQIWLLQQLHQYRFWKWLRPVAYRIVWATAKLPPVFMVRPDHKFCRHTALWTMDLKRLVVGKITPVVHLDYFHRSLQCDAMSAARVSTSLNMG